MSKVNLASEAVTKYGNKGLSEWQLLTCMGIPEASAKELLNKVGHQLGELAKLSISEVAKVKGIGRNRAAGVIAAMELGRRRQMENGTNKGQITSSADCYEILHPQMRDLNQEAFFVMFLDRRSKLICVDMIHLGGMNAMVVDPKVIFQKALEYKASSIILSHNHPSGASSPSNEDIRLTEKVKQGGNVLDIKVLDHLIIGDGNYYSFADEGKM